MYALIVKDKTTEDSKLKFKTFQQAVDHACSIIVPQISDAIDGQLEQEQEDHLPLQQEVYEMIDILRELYKGDRRRVEEAIERWARLAEHDNFGDMWVVLV
jgi:hypothetical protein